MTISRKVHFRLGKNTANKICRGELHEVKRKITRSAELMAFAIIFDGWLESGKVAGYSEIAQITGISVPAVSRIMNYRLKSLRWQEGVIFGKILA